MWTACRPKRENECADIKRQRLCLCIYRSFSKQKVGFPNPLAVAANMEEQGAWWGVSEGALLIFVLLCTSFCAADLSTLWLLWMPPLAAVQQSRPAATPNQAPSDIFDVSPYFGDIGNSECWWAIPAWVWMRWTGKSIDHLLHLVRSEVVFGMFPGCCLGSW